MIRKERYELYTCEIVVPKTAEEYAADVNAAVFGKFFVDKIKTISGLYLAILDTKGYVKVSWDGLTVEEWESMLSESDGAANGSWDHPDSGRRYWLVRREFYSETENLTADQVWALVVHKQKTKERKLKRAIATVSIDDMDKKRAPIPDDVKIFVWRRDEGKCTRCNNNADLEFDHIVPLAMGGSNTAKNIQLLCAECNQAKGPNMA